MSESALPGAVLTDEAAPHSLATVNATYRRITWRLIPFLFVCYVAAYLDRINIGFAQIQMRNDLGFSDAVYGLGAGIFFAGYFLFEVPSNLVLERIGARKTLIRIMLLWGLTSAGMMFVKSPTTFYIMRFMLGVFEAGFFPGMIFYLTYWYPAERRGRVMALFLTAVAMAGVLGGPVSGWALNRLDGLHGLQGWQWLFLVEGLPSCLLGIAAYFHLDDNPREARWLSDAEKTIVRHQLDKERDAGSPFDRHGFGGALKSGRIYALAFVWFTFICGVYAISFWLPALIRGAGVTDAYSIGMLSAIPYGVAVLTMVLVSRHSDRTRERRWHTAACALIGAAALSAIAGTGSDLTLALACISVATACIFTLQPLFWAIATDFLAGTRAAAGTIAFINSLGLLGGFASPSMLGFVKTVTGSLNNGLYVVSALLVTGALITLRRAGRPVR
ncbi:MFS transporter [Caballeronia ptereochthonis]|uniref:Major facilitator transporter n=1 Tax=Caballeronia ptereochthonis TaxID=1777144 RepID=A0A158B3A0_9BURK|nr:MFS transporter [Caballeronia ptereochthonis]SAK64473.1 major facilitator transporter [Caballeronia ptereochthonis]